ncbi:MAG: hypothetical protein KGL16_06780 [Acidobacteriota bacterium]|nr:hypothetical protein [Acidobacteriota bacterium]
MDGAEGSRRDLPDSAASLVDLAARWMRNAGLTGPLAGGSIEFTFDQHARVSGYFVKTRGGRRDLEPGRGVGGTS